MHPGDDLTPTTLPAHSPAPTAAAAPAVQRVPRYLAVVKLLLTLKELNGS